MHKKNAPGDRRTLRTRQNFKNALVDLMAEKEFDSITITDIVKLANSKRATFYFHYGYKEELFKDLMDDLIDGMASALTPSSAYQRADFHEVTLRLFNHCAGHAKAFQVLQTQARKQFWTQIGETNIITRMLEVVSTFFYKETSILYKDGGINPINKTVYLSFMTSAYLGMITDWIEDGLKYSPKYMADQIVQIVDFDPAKLCFHSLN